jgi:dephospho-CoA kinase
MDAALLFGSPRVGMVGRMLVDVDPEIAIERLVRFRGFTEADARARIASQVGRAERLALADFVIDNSGDMAMLIAQVDSAWAWIQTLPESPSVGPDGAPVGSVPKPTQPPPSSSCPHPTMTP